MKFKVEVSVHSEDKEDNNKAGGSEKKEGKDKSDDSKKKDTKNLEVNLHSCTQVCMTKGCMYTAEIKDLTPSTNYDVSLTLLGLLSEEDKEWVKSDPATAQFSTV